MPYADPSERFANMVELDQVMHALAHPVRRFMLELIMFEGAYAGDLAASAAANFGISPQRGSQHLKVLVQAELVHVTADGSWRFHRLNRGSTDAVTRWLSALWA